MKLEYRNIILSTGANVIAIINIKVIKLQTVLIKIVGATICL